MSRVSNHEKSLCSPAIWTTWPPLSGTQDELVTGTGSIPRIVVTSTINENIAFSDRWHVSVHGYLFIPSFPSLDGYPTFVTRLLDNYQGTLTMTAVMVKAIRYPAHSIYLRLPQ